MSYEIPEIETVTGPMDNDLTDVPRVRLTEKLGVFERETAPHDSMSSEDEQRIELFVKTAARYRPFLGKAEPSMSRVAMQAIGHRGERFFVLPTDTGAACYLLGATAFGCMAQLVEDLIGWNATTMHESDGRTRVAVHGLVANDVETVDVSFRTGLGQGRVLVPAHVEGNAFYAEHLHSEADPTEMLELIVGSGGARQVISMGA